MSPEPARGTLGYVMVLLAATCWATGGLLARWIFVSPELALSPVDLSAARAVVSAGILFVWVAIFQRPSLRISRRDVGFLVVFGVAGQALLHLTYYEAIATAGVAPAILLEYLAPVIVLVVSATFMKERVTWVLPAGVALAILGCALVVGVVGGAETVVPLTGVAWGLASAVLFATYMLMGRHAATRFSAWTFLTYGLGAAAVFWAVVLGPGRIGSVLVDPGTLAAVAYVAVVSTIVPFGLFLVALKHLDATRAGVTATIEPVLAGVGAWIALGEGLNGWQVAGAALVVTAIVLVQLPGRTPVSAVPPGT